eukprot:763409-Hanusia_phi.AAC.2
MGNISSLDLLEDMQRVAARLKGDVFMVAFEVIPTAALSLKIMLTLEQTSAINLASLLLSTVVLGIKMSGLSTYPTLLRDINREKILIGNEVRMLMDDVRNDTVMPISVSVEGKEDTSNVPMIRHEVDLSTAPVRMEGMSAVVPGPHS